MKYMYIGADQTAGKRNNYPIFIAGSSLMMATPRKIYDTVSKTIILNVFKYFKKLKREYILLNMKERSKTNVKNIRKK